jgi:hypothetical protein
MFKKSAVHHTPDTDTEHKAHLHRYAKHNYHKQLSKAHPRKGSQQWPNPRKYNPRSLCLFDLRHPFRRLVIAGRALQDSYALVLSRAHLNRIVGAKLFTIAMSRFASEGVPYH